MTNPPPSNNSRTRNVALIGLAVMLASQIPTTLQEISDPLIRGAAQVVILLIVIVAMFKVNPK